MSENLQNLLEDFVREAGLESIATAIVDFYGKEHAYAIHGTFDKDFKSEHAASVFVMVVNFLNKTLGGIHLENDEVEEILVTSKHGYFFLEVLQHEKYFQGVAVTKKEDIGKIRKLVKKYEPKFIEIIEKI